LRLVRLTRPFRASQQYHAPAKSPEGRAVVRVIRELSDEEAPLPGSEDYETLIPPSRRCMCRPIRSAGLVVCYAVAADAVILLAVKPAP
jgi:hypothetical protein